MKPCPALWPAAHFPVHLLVSKEQKLDLKQREHRAQPSRARATSLTGESWAHEEKLWFGRKQLRCQITQTIQKVWNTPRAVIWEGELDLLVWGEKKAVTSVSHWLLTSQSIPTHTNTSMHKLTCEWMKMFMYVYICLWKHTYIIPWYISFFFTTYVNSLHGQTDALSCTQSS